MFRRNLFLGCAVGMLALSPPALAAVSVSGHSGGAGAVLNGGGYDVDVTAGAGATVTVTVTSNSAINHVRVTCTGSSLGHVLLDFAGALGGIAEITRVGGSTSELWLGDLSAPSLSDITVNKVDSLVATASSFGDISGTVSVLGSNHASSGTTVDRIKSNNGLITANISSVLPVDSIEASNGTIGTSGALVTITTTGDIGDIKAKEVHATITINSGGGDLNSLITNYTGSSGGVFRGSLTCRKIVGVGAPNGYGLDVLGDLEADIDHDNNNSAASVMATNFRIGGSLLGDILLPTDGLTRQIIIDANDANESWTGDVKLNGVAISHDSNGVYTDHQDDLGGGAVGLATFRFHPEGCDPPHASSVNQWYFDPEWIGEGDPPCETVSDFTTVTIRHFGPVREPTSPPAETIYQIWATYIGCEGDFPCSGSTDVTEEFDIATGGDDGREVVITRKSMHNGGKWDADYEYHIVLQGESANDTALESEDVNGLPRVPLYHYWVALPGCPEGLDMLYDQNGDGALTESDVSAWPGTNADVSRDGNVTAFDLYKLICGQVQRAGTP